MTIVRYMTIVLPRVEVPKTILTPVSKGERVSIEGGEGFVVVSIRSHERLIPVCVSEALEGRSPIIRQSFLFRKDNIPFLFP